MVRVFIELSILISLVNVVRCQTCSKLATFNAGLLHNVGDYSDREPEIADALAENDADVYCLQEVWLESDLERLLDEVSSVYPYHYSAIHYRLNALRKPSDEMSWLEYIQSMLEVLDSPCSTSDILNFGIDIGICAYHHDCYSAFDNSSVLGAECLAQNCRDELKSHSIRPQCISCLVLMGSGVSEVVEACAPDIFEQNNRLNKPGLVLLSKKPISKISYTSYFPQKDMTVERGYLEADIDDIGKVVCTHLTSVNEYFLEYDTDFTNYMDQQNAEIHQLIAKFKDINHLLVGDLNTGPEVANYDEPEKNLKWEMEEHFKRLNQSGYRAPYFEQDGRCTFCEDNPLQSSDNKAIDHILVKGDGVKVDKIYRVLDQTVPTQLSDHYGVEAKVCIVE